MFETLLSLLGGGVLRVVPEVLGLLNKKADNAHELQMLEKQFQLEQTRAGAKQAELEIQGDIAQSIAALSAQEEALKGQMQKSGIPWVDALNTLVRPATTYWFLFLYSVVKFSTIMAALNEVAVWTAIRQCWTPDDMAILSGILSFWFVGRVFDKRQ